MLEGHAPPYLEEIEPGGALPELGTQKINMYRAPGGEREVLTTLADMLRQGFAVL